MSSQRALSDDQVASELRKMETFIKKEAEEKAKEIRLKADEEYEIEKASIVRSEINTIDALYDTKFKKSSLAQQITKSTITNKTRLKVLATREEVLDEIFDQAEEELKKISKDKKKYEPILAGLIAEGLFALMEKKITLRVREEDESVAEKAAKQAAKDFEAQAGYTPEISLDGENHLNKDLAGGVVVINASGKIEVNNTLEERLKLLNEEALPAVRLQLFGPSASRKFFD